MKTFLKILNILLFIVSFSFALYFGINNNTFEMGMMITFFIITGVFIYIDYFISVKIGKDGFEAKLKDLNNEINLTKKLFINFSSIMLTSLSRAGNWGGISDNEKDVIKNDLLRSLKECGFKEKDIIEVTDVPNKYTLMDMYIEIHNILSDMFRGIPSSDKKEASEKFKSDFSIDHNNWLLSRKTSEELRVYIEKYNLMNEQLNILLEKYNNYEKIFTK